MEGSSAGCIKDPVETGGEDEKCSTMQNLIIHYGAYLHTTEPGVGCYEEDKNEGTYGRLKLDRASESRIEFKPAKGSLMRILKRELSLYA